MDTMKAMDPDEVMLDDDIEIMPDGTVMHITKRDENGKPIAGRYSMKAESEKLANMMLGGATKEEIEKEVQRSIEMMDANKQGGYSW